MNDRETDDDLAISEEIISSLEQTARRVIDDHQSTSSAEVIFDDPTNQNIALSYPKSLSIEEGVSKLGNVKLAKIQEMTKKERTKLL